MMKKRGFTLLESMVAVTILSIAVAGPLYSASRALVAATMAKDRLTASYLAQEGIEFVRYVRDNVYLSNYPADTNEAWDDFINSSTIGICTKEKFCTVNTVKYAVSGSIGPLYRDTNGQYVQTSGSGAVVTPFTRKVQIEPVSGEEEVKVISIVEWDYKGKSYSIEIVDQLTAWQ